MTAGEGTGRRRTQQERRGTTIAALVDAAIEVLAEVGYARASVQQVVDRAGLSQGALFRHFATRLDLFAHVAEVVADRQIAEFRSELGDKDGRGVRDFTAILSTVRRITRSRTNMVWHELMFHARTDAELRARMAELSVQYLDAMEELVESIPETQVFPDMIRRALLEFVIGYFTGESIGRQVVPDADADQRQLELLGYIAGVLATEA
ncbi:TetR/AcrR family transcriptional regulator [Hoyosella subflava]|uniref:Hypothetical transcriptional regulatory protein n=1 Tax=Hoyosella subflava (strain DSM 45089 / JCM 17490 / NBRC 109087 / DQS3-9A1) TaxID=443218 RepID=F6EIK0_HOYSD|nr:TetR/AcrR family transcriptional regulator [Hoyosella subflava]AEF42492.1 Hypothetical transcriptional regulatory protein [Hoyosella subflava DQS3-9A1]